MSLGVSLGLKTSQNKSIGKLSLNLPLKEKATDKPIKTNLSRKASNTKCNNNNSNSNSLSKTNISSQSKAVKLDKNISYLKLSSNLSKLNNLSLSKLNTNTNKSLQLTIKTNSESSHINKDLNGEDNVKGKDNEIANLKLQSRSKKVSLNLNSKPPTYNYMIYANTTTSSNVGKNGFSSSDINPDCNPCHLNSTNNNIVKVTSIIKTNKEKDNEKTGVSCNSNNNPYNNVDSNTKNTLNLKSQNFSSKSNSKSRKL